MKLLGTIIVTAFLFNTAHSAILEKACIVARRTCPVNYASTIFTKNHHTLARENTPKESLPYNKIVATLDFMGTHQSKVFSKEFDEIKNILRSKSDKVEENYPIFKSTLNIELAKYGGIGTLVWLSGVIPMTIASGGVALTHAAAAASLSDPTMGDVVLIADVLGGAVSYCIGSVIGFGAIPYGIHRGLRSMHKTNPMAYTDMVNRQSSLKRRFMYKGKQEIVPPGLKIVSPKEADESLAKAILEYDTKTRENISKILWTAAEDDEELNKFLSSDFDKDTAPQSSRQ